MGARRSGRFSVNEPTRLEFSKSCQRSDSEAASTPRSDGDNLRHFPMPQRGIGLQPNVAATPLRWGQEGGWSNNPNNMR